MALAVSKHPPLILPALPESAHAAVCVNLDHVRQNYKTLTHMASFAHCSAVLKANGYGVGALEVLPILINEGCQVFFVAYVEEGISLRTYLNTHFPSHSATIYVLNGLFDFTQEAFLIYNLIPVLTDHGQVKAWKKKAAELEKTLPAALHFDTGMSRTGIPLDEQERLLGDPAAFEGLHIKTIMSHLACSDLTDHHFNAVQRRRFDIIRSFFPGIPASLANSGGIFLGKSYHYDLVRPGIALWGIPPNSFHSHGLLPAVSVWARIYQVQQLRIGQTVGYHQTYTALHPQRIATITLGYADGYPFQIGGNQNGRVAINGISAPILGRISMDLLTIDISHLPEGMVQAGQWVELIGPTIPIEEVAKHAGTIPYEVLLGLGPRLYRSYTHF